jgi:hypothetical protein
LTLINLLMPCSYLILYSLGNNEPRKVASWREHEDVTELHLRGHNNCTQSSLHFSGRASASPSPLDNP